MVNIINMCPVVYWSYRNGIMTTGSYVTPADDSNIKEQLLDEICDFEGERIEDVMIVRQENRWDICIKGRFTPIGKVYALAMLDPDYRKSKDSKPLMEIFLEGGVRQLIDVDALAADLSEVACELVTVSKHGELVIDDFSHGHDYKYRREVWQMRNEGEGTSNQNWAGHGWEFCRSVPMIG